MRRAKVINIPMDLRSVRGGAGVRRVRRVRSEATSEQLSDI